jgi:protein phosphatase inhibitor 2
MRNLEQLKLEKKHQGVRFDEAVIAEHDKDRGTRMTIDEPDTPFARSPLMSESEDDGGHHGHPKFHLDTSSPTSARSEDEHAAFKAKRKAHYNEFKVVKAMDASSSSGDDGQ